MNAISNIYGIVPTRLQNNAAVPACGNSYALKSLHRSTIHNMMTLNTLFRTSILQHINIINSSILILVATTNKHSISLRHSNIITPRSRSIRTCMHTIQIIPARNTNQPQNGCLKKLLIPAALAMSHSEIMNAVIKAVSWWLVKFYGAVRRSRE